MHKLITLMRHIGLAATLSGALAASAFAQSVSFIEPIDGATVTSPFKVKFGIAGMDVKPAGDMTTDTGHHHLLIDAGSIEAGAPVPNDATHLHFGKGQTETEVRLAPGLHTLTLQFADGAHRSYGAAMSQSIKVTVK